MILEGSGMFLLSYDIIDSRSHEIKLGEIEELNDYFIELSKKYQLNLDYIQIHDGDQVRVLLEKNKFQMEIILNIFAFLTRYKLKARLFISEGELSTKPSGRLQGLDGSVFHLNRELEKCCKADASYYREKNNSIRFKSSNEVESQLIDILFMTFSKLALKKTRNATIINSYLYNKSTQIELAKQLGITQVAVSSRLKNMDIKFLKRLLEQIEFQLKK